MPLPLSASLPPQTATRLLCAVVACGAVGCLSGAQNAPLGVLGPLATQLAAVRAAWAARAAHLLLDGVSLPLAPQHALLVTAAPRPPPPLAPSRLPAAAASAAASRAALPHALLCALRPVAVAPMALEPRLHAELLLHGFPEPQALCKMLMGVRAQAAALLSSEVVEGSLLDTPRLLAVVRAAAEAWRSGQLATETEKVEKEEEAERVMAEREGFRRPKRSGDDSATGSSGGATPDKPGTPEAGKLRKLARQHSAAWHVNTKRLPTELVINTVARLQKHAPSSDGGSSGGSDGADATPDQARAMPSNPWPHAASQPPALRPRPSSHHPSDPSRRRHPVVGAPPPASPSRPLCPRPRRLGARQRAASPRASRRSRPACSSPRSRSILARRAPLPRRSV